MVVIDTSIIIDHLRYKGKDQTILMKLASKYSIDELGISVITIQELYEGKSTQNPEKEAFMIATISPLKILDYDFQIAQLAGELARDLGKVIELADAAIAATSIRYEASIATLNTKDFLSIKDIILEKI